MTAWTALVDATTAQAVDVRFVGPALEGMAPGVPVSGSQNDRLPTALKNAVLIERVGNPTQSVFVLLDGQTQSGLDGVGSPATQLGEEFLRSGEICLDRLSGEWLLLIVDTKRRHILASRDALGTRPFFYRRVGDVWLFGSQARALATYPVLPKCEADEASILEWISGVRRRAWTSMFRGVYRLPPGCRLDINRNSGQLSTWWQMSPWGLREESLADGQARFEEALTTSVRNSLRNAKSPAIALSGGLDSSTIAMIATRLSERGELERPTAISARFPLHPACDESVEIQQLVAGFGITGHWVEPRAEGIPNDPSSCLADHPVELSVHPVLSAIGRLAACLGNDFIALGTEGDIVGGRPSRWPGLVIENLSPAVQERLPLPLAFRRVRSALQAVAPVRPRWLRAQNRILTRVLRCPAGQDTIQRLSSIGHWVFAKPFGARAEESFSLAGVEDDEATTMLQVLRRFGLNPVLPFLERRVVEASLALSWSARSRFGLTRWVEREMLRGSVPDSVRLASRKRLCNSFYDEYRTNLIENCWPSGRHQIWEVVDSTWLRKSLGSGNERDRVLIGVTSRVILSALWLDSLSAPAGDLWIPEIQPLERRNSA